MAITDSSPANPYAPAGPFPTVDQDTLDQAAVNQAAAHRFDDVQADTAPVDGGQDGAAVAVTDLSGVTPQAPLDVRVLDAIGELLQARPRWSEPGPSMAEAWEYSRRGDWIEHEKSVKRVLHGLCVVIAFVVTYPIDWMVQVSRQKPIGFLLVIAVLFVLSKVL